MVQPTPPDGGPGADSPDGIVRGADASEPLALSATDARDELNVFFEVSLDLLCILRPDAQLERANAALSSTLGYAPGELHGRSLAELVHPADLVGTLREVARVNESREAPHPFLTRVLGADGGYRHLEWQWRRHQDRVYASARDVSARVAAERALLQQKESFEAFFDLLPDLLTIADEQGRILNVGSVKSGTEVPEILAL
jgi:PAS domain S-box-containing protein